MRAEGDEHISQCELRHVKFLRNNLMDLRNEGNYRADVTSVVLSSSSMTQCSLIHILNKTRQTLEATLT